MLGSPFSPGYFDARERRPHAADPLRFAAFNVAVYGERASRWALHETARVDRAAEAVRIGDSTFARDGGRFEASIDAPAAAPRFGRVRGIVRATALGWSGETTALDADGKHAWRTFVPRARVEVELEEPRVRWSGWGYVDGNSGDEPLERAMRGWSWSRAHFDDGRTLLSYATEARDGRVTNVARVVDPSGTSRAIALRPAPLPPTRWGLSRTTQAEGERGARVVRSLEDTPFYSRSLVEVDALGERAAGMHETLSLDRFVKPWVRFLLPFRMRRERTP